MIFKRVTSPLAIRPPRPRARRGAFALEPADALPRLAERIGRLAERALEPNPFYLPAFLQPAIQALGPKNLRLAIFSDRDDLCFFAPVVAYGGRFFAPKLSVWTHPYAPLGAPLIDRESAATVADSLLDHMKRSGRRLLLVPDLPLAGPAAAALRAAAARRGYVAAAGRDMRPVLTAGGGDEPASFDAMVTQKRRRELDRQLRKLSEGGAVSLMTARTASDIEAAFEMFVALEESGWKGRRGTALKRRRPILDFAHSAVTRLAREGLAAIDVLRVGEGPVAALIRFEQAGLSIPWKIAYDESFAAFSPGRQLICDATRRWLADASVRRVDPVCEEGNPLFAGLWREREPYGTLVLSPRRLALGARLKAGTINLRKAAKRSAKALIRGRKRSLTATPRRDRRRTDRSKP
jgi:CelD/BcsL family acetyltransferase involved in cellulose biosynthesis